MTRIPLSFRFVRLLLPLLLLATQPAFGAPLTAGDRFPVLHLTDQHDEAVAIADDTQVVLFSRDMTGAGLIKDVLQDSGPAVLARAKAVVLSDISRMPSIITRLFALPAMRRRAYTMVLDRDGKATADVPSLASHVTVIRLDKGTVTNITTVDTIDKLAAAIAEASPTTPEATQP